jgi:epidermal growth factor receptor substrate 15
LVLVGINCYMRIFSLLIALFVGVQLYAQDPMIQIDVTANDDETGKRLDGAVAEIYQDGKPFKTVTSSSGGKFPIVDVPLNHIYTVYIKKTGYVTKVAEIDGNYDYPEDLPPVTYVQMQTSLFKTMEGIDFSFLETQPMIKFAYTADGYQDYDKKYTQDMLVKIENLKKQMEIQRQENIKKEQEKAKLTADFNAYVKAGDAAMTQSNYTTAITQYELALKLIPGDPGVTAKLEDAKKKLAEKENADAAQKAYSAKVEAAKIAYTAKKYEEALALYEEALGLKPGDQFATSQIAIIKQEIQKQKDAEAKFNTLVTQGDASMTAQMYDDAIAKYTEALTLKPNDPTVTAKLAEAKKKKLEKEQGDALAKEKEAKYNKLLTEANTAFDSKQYDAALAKYKEALTVKPGEPVPTNRITEIENIKKKQQEDLDAANKKEADYQKAMTEGNTAFTAKTWEAAKAKYEAALAIKPGDAAALAKIDLCNKEIEKAALDAKTNQAYTAAMTEAKALFDQKKYAEAKAKYTEAKSIKPAETEPATQIALCDKYIADAEKMAQVEKDYQAAITEGNALKDQKNYLAAIDKYNKALALKPGDPVATEKIAQINKILEEEKKAAEQQKLYDGYITKAETAFNAKDYTNAKVNYQEAFKIKADPAITAKIQEIDAIIAKNQDAAQTQAKYDAAMKEADALYKAGNLDGALAKYKEASAIKSTEQLPKDKIYEIEQKIAAQKEQAAKDQAFKDYVATADAAFTAGDYQKALANYQEAIKIKPDPTITQKIGQVNTKITEQNQNAEVNAKYQAKIAEADAAFNAKSWETARQLYRDAQLIKASETYPATRIAEIEKQMKAETDAEVEKNYQKIIAKADGLKAEERFDEAISYYQNAVNLKPTDPYPKQKIEEIKKIQQDRANATTQAEALEKEYQAAIKAADEAFNAKNYTLALAKYKEALLKKPNDPYPTGRISEINTLIANQNQQNATEEKYKAYIAQADGMFNSKQYLASIPVYKQALEVKPNDAYAKTQIEEATRLEQAHSVDEVEVQYQKILTVAQEKFDAGDYTKALELYKRAKDMRPSDPLPQKRIDEINQIIKNQGTNAEFDKYRLQADTYFEQGKWLEAKQFYEKALGVKNDDYCVRQLDIIKQKIKEETEGQVSEQYLKIIKKADELFNAKDYTKSLEYYNRAIGIKPSDEYVQGRITEIDKILHPEKYVTKSNGLNDYGPAINTTEVDIDAMMNDANEQRKFNDQKKAEQQRLLAEDQVSLDNINQTNDNFQTEGESEQISVDLDEKEWSAETKREEANQEVVEMQYELVEQDREWGIINENDSQFQNTAVDNINTDLEVRREESDLPREEYLADVERIEVEITETERVDASFQTDATFYQKEEVTRMDEDHIVNDPNNDVDRKNTEVYVEDYDITVINKNNQDSWAQEDATIDAKDHTEVLVDERTASTVNSDIPREEGVNSVNAMNLDIETRDRNLANDQYDVTVESKTYTEGMTTEIEMNNMDNDIPRQKTEIAVEDEEVYVEEILTDFSRDQNAVVNSTDDKLDNFEIVMEVDAKENDQNREAFEVDVVDINQQIQDQQDENTILTQNNSYSTVDYTEGMTDLKTTNDANADYKQTVNGDATNSAVEDLVQENTMISEGNDAEVDEVEDYTEGLKDLDPNPEVPNKPNELGQKYPEGVTEEVFAKNDENGLLVSYIVRRIVVIKGTGYVYEKIQSRYGTITYFRDGESISEYQWSDETEAATLTRN